MAEYDLGYVPQPRRLLRAGGFELTDFVARRKATDRQTSRHPLSTGSRGHHSAGQYGVDHRPHLFDVGDQCAEQPVAGREEAGRPETVQQ